MRFAYPLTLGGYAPHRGKWEMSKLTWHCWGPWRVGDEVFGLCFFTTDANETAVVVVWLEFDEGVIEVAIDVIIEGWWVDTTIDAFDVDVFCAAAATAAAATVSITLATVRRWKVEKNKLKFSFIATRTTGEWESDAKSCWNSTSQPEIEFSSLFIHTRERVKKFGHVSDKNDHFQRSVTSRT